MKSKQTNNLSKMKAKADKYFSLYIRYRDSEKRGGEYQASCITCEKWLPTKQMHAGHFQSRRYSSTRYDDENVNAQCLTAESNLKMFNGKNKSIAKIDEGDELWAFNEDTHSLERATVESVYSFLPHELYEVELEDGHKFYATPDHQVVANGEWVYIKDMLHSVSTYDILEL